MRILPIFSALCLAAFPAAAQQAAPADDPSLLDEEDGLSELERLSRTEGDPFAGVLEREEREPVSVTLRALNKVTARYTDIEIEMNEIARFGALELLPRTCDKRPPEEFPETTAFLEIFDTKSDINRSNLKRPLEAAPVSQDDEAPSPGLFEVEPALERFDGPGAAMSPAPEVLEGPQAEGENIFRGWMFASSPALNALEHPVYDVWVIDCTTRIASN